MFMSFDHYKKWSLF